jgi:spermidine/putrescine transport system permease protein
MSEPAASDTPSTNKRPNKRAKVILYNGEMINPWFMRLRQALLISPGMLTIILLLALPGLSLFVVSFLTRGDYGELVMTFTKDNFKRLYGHGFFGWSPDNLIILWRSVRIAFFTTLICILLSYPLAFFLASRPHKTRIIWLTLLLVPFWTNLVIRTYAWLLALAPDMPVAKILSLLGIIDADTPLYPGTFAVYVGMVSTFLPFVALPLYTAVEKLDWSLVEAAQDLYANPLRVFRIAILPQTMPGLSVGVILTFVPAMGMFVVPDMLGGSRTMLIGNLIQQQFGTSRDWPFGAAISLVLMILTLTALMASRRNQNFGTH